MKEHKKTTQHRAVAPTTVCMTMAVQVLSANHTSIRKPHPVQLQARDCVYASPVSGRKLSQNLQSALPTHLLQFQTEIVRKATKVSNLAFQNTWFRQWPWLHYLHWDLAYCLFAWKLLKLGALMNVTYLAIQVEISLLRPCNICKIHNRCSVVFLHSFISSLFLYFFLAHP